MTMILLRTRYSRFRFYDGGEHQTIDGDQQVCGYIREEMIEIQVNKRRSKELVDMEVLEVNLQA